METESQHRPYEGAGRGIPAAERTEYAGAGKADKLFSLVLAELWRSHHKNFAGGSGDQRSSLFSQF